MILDSLLEQLSIFRTSSLIGLLYKTNRQELGNRMPWMRVNGDVGCVSSLGASGEMTI